jgi:hypothetical protein
MNIIEKIGKDGFPIYKRGFKVAPGVRVGTLTIEKRVPAPEHIKCKDKVFWQCVCDCGEVVVKRSDYLVDGALRGGSGANKNKGCRTCGIGACDKSGIKNRNIAGRIISSHTETTVGGALIIAETDYIDLSNRSTIVVCECSKCGKCFPTTRRSQTTTCGCLQGRLPRTVEDFAAERGCRSLGELNIFNLLNKMKLNFTQERKFNDLVDKARLPFDFYVYGPDGDYIIEYDGQQHFKEISYFNNFKDTRKHDLMKNQYCFSHNIPIIRIPYTVVDITEDDIKLETSNHILTPENQKEYYGG